MKTLQTEPSTIERFLNTKKTFKRNKHLVNLKSFNTIQIQQQIIRRTPKVTDINVGRKIQDSFLCSTTALSDRVQQNIFKFKQRMAKTSLSHERVYSEYFNSKVTENSFFNQSCNLNDQCCRTDEIRLNTIKNAISMQKMLSRQYSSKVQCKTMDTPDQRLFNNFKTFKVDFAHTPDFNKYTTRPNSANQSSRNSANIPKDCSLQINKKYCKYYFKSNAMKCTFNYKTQKKEKGRVYSFQKKPEDLPPQIDRDLVLLAEKQTLKTQKSAVFFRDQGRQVPSSVQKKLLQANTNFYAIKMPQTESQTIKKAHFSRVKKQLIQKRISEIRNRKKAIKFKQHEICDIKFFRLAESQRC